MKAVDPVAARELPLIRKIIEDETWLESERRGCRVLSTDRVVRQKVCEVILRIGQELRDTLSLTESGPVLGLPATGTSLTGDGSSWSTREQTITQPAPERRPAA